MATLLRGDTGYKAGHGDSLRQLLVAIGAKGSGVIIDPAAFTWGYDIPAKNQLTSNKIKTWSIGTAAAPAGYATGDLLLAIGPNAQLTGDSYGPPFELKGSIMFIGLDLAPSGRLYGANGANNVAVPATSLVRGIDTIFDVTFASTAQHWAQWQQEPNDYVQWPIVFFCNSRVNFQTNGCKFGKIMKVKVTGAAANDANGNYVGPKAGVFINKVDVVKGPLTVNNLYTSTGAFVSQFTAASSVLTSGGGVPLWRMADIHVDFPMGRFFYQNAEATSVCGFPRDSRIRIKNSVFEHTVRWSTTAADPVQTGAANLTATSPHVLDTVSGAGAPREVSDYASGRYWPVLFEGTNLVWRGFANANTDVASFILPAEGITSRDTAGNYSFATTIGTTATFRAYEGPLQLLEVGQVKPANPVKASHIGLPARLTSGAALLEALGLPTDPEDPTDEDLAMDGKFYGIDGSADRASWSPYRYRRPVAVRFRAEFDGYYIIGVRFRNRYNEGGTETDATSDRSAGDGGTIRIEIRPSEQDSNEPPLAAGTGEDRYAPLPAGDVNLLGRSNDFTAPINIGRYPEIAFQSPVPIIRNERYWLVFHQLDSTRTKWVSLESNQLMGFTPGASDSDGGPWWHDDLRIAEAGPPTAGTPSFAWRSGVQAGFSRHLAKVQPHYRNDAGKNLFGGVGTAFAAGVSSAAAPPPPDLPKDPGTAGAGNQNIVVTDRASFLTAYNTTAKAGDHIVCSAGSYSGNYTLNRSFAAPGIVIRGASMATNGIDPQAIFPGQISITGDGHWLNQLRFNWTTTSTTDQPTSMAVYVLAARIVITRCFFNSNHCVGWEDSVACHDNKLGWCRINSPTGTYTVVYMKLQLNELQHGSTKHANFKYYRNYVGNFGPAGQGYTFYIGDGHTKPGADRVILGMEIIENFIDSISTGTDKGFYLKCGPGSFSGNTLTGPASCILRHGSIVTGRRTKDSNGLPTDSQYNSATTITCPKFWSNWLDTTVCNFSGAGVDIRSNRFMSHVDLFGGSSNAGSAMKNAASNILMVANDFTSAPANPIEWGHQETSAQALDLTMGGYPVNLHIWGHTGTALGTPAQMSGVFGIANEINIHTGTGTYEIPPAAVRLTATDVGFERTGQSARS